MWIHLPSSVSTQVEADLTSDSDSRIQTLAQSVTWKETQRLSRSWWTTCRRDSWMMRLCGQIPEPSTADRGAAKWIGSLAGSRVNLSQLPASGKGPTTNAGSGLTSSDWFARYDPEESSWRTSQASFMEELNTFSEGWPRSGTMRNGLLYERPTLVRPTAGSGSSSWPTATATDDHRDRGSLEMKKRWKARPDSGSDLAIEVALWKTPTTDSASQRTGRYAQGGLPLSLQAVDNWHTPDTMPDAPNSGSNTKSKPPGLGNQSRQWMTPKAHEPGRTAITQGRPLDMATHLNTQASHWDSHQVQEMPMPGPESSENDPTSHRRWSTPNAMDGSEVVAQRTLSSHYEREAKLKKANPKLGALQMPLATQAQGNSLKRLNPKFVEWLMGLPEDWLELTAFASSGTE